MSLTDELIGYYGLAAILGGYLAISFEYILPTSAPYYLLNATGAAGIGYIAWKKKSMQPVVLNIIWALVAIAGLFL